MSDEKRTLIETFLPVMEISEEAKFEKNGRAPTFELHYWWTRKPLVTARAAVLGALLPSDYDITDFKKLLGLGMEKRAHNFDINPAQLEKLRQEYAKVWGTENPVRIYYILARIIKHSCTYIKVGREGNENSVWDPFP